jgi:sugar O-acyltransferase (sialic acid O-acetyltransferase NeuD family)
LGARWATLVHPTATIGPGSTVGEGCILCAASGVTAGCRVGKHVVFNFYSGAGHDARIGDFCTLSGHADITGHAVLEEGVFVGSHGVVLPRAHVGAWATVGAGSVVLRSVPPGATVFGVPAKVINPEE